MGILGKVEYKNPPFLVSCILNGYGRKRYSQKSVCVCMCVRVRACMHVD